MLQNCVGNKAVVHTRKDKDPAGLNFCQSEDTKVKGTNGKLHANAKYTKCKQLENYQIHCTVCESDKEEEEEGVRHFQAQDPVFLIYCDSDNDVGSH